jgi:hypothetical protein
MLRDAKDLERDALILLACKTSTQLVLYYGSSWYSARRMNIPPDP